MKFSPLVRDDLIASHCLRLTPENQGDWLNFLENHSTFRWESSGNPAVRFSAVKDSKGFWKASKRVNGVLRQKRLGNSLTLSKRSADELYQIAVELGGERPPVVTALQLVEAEMKGLEHRKTSERVKLAWEVLERLHSQLSHS